MLKTNQLKLALLCGLTISLFCFGETCVKADTITFDDLPVAAGGIQQIPVEQYRPQGLLIFGTNRRQSIAQADSANTPPNFLFGGTDPFQTTNELTTRFVLPGTDTPAATNSISFYIVATDDTQNASWQLFVTSVGEPLAGAGGPGGLVGRGNAFFSLSAPFNRILGFTLVYNDFATGTRFNGRIGIDTLTFNQLAEPIPEPATMILLGTGLVGIAAQVRRRRTAKKRD